MGKRKVTDLSKRSFVLRAEPSAAAELKKKKKVAQDRAHLSD